MTNSSLPTDFSSTPNAQTQGITEIRQKKIAALIARGFHVKYVAKKLKISGSRIYHLVSEENSLVNAEINRILNETFAASDYRLINLYDKALEKLDAMLSSPDEEKQCRAIDRIIKMFFARTAKNTIIQQYFSDQPQQKEITFDDFILFNEKRNKTMLQMRKERGLDKTPDDDDKERSDSPSDTSAPDASAPNDSSPDNSLADTSSPECKAFLESVK
jgi:hypothetical protein